MASSEVDVKDQGQGVWHKDFVLVQLGHIDIQRLAWVGFRGVECYTLDRAYCLQAAVFFLLNVGSRLSDTDII